MRALRRARIPALAGAALATTMTLALAGPGLSGSAGATGGTSSKAPITIAMLGSITGPGAVQYANSPKAFLARIALQNAEGGVHGHKLVPVVVNDAGNFTAETSIAQGAIQTKGAFGVVSVTPFMFEAYRWLQKNGIPVTGSSADGPEWWEAAENNMFPSDDGAVESVPNTAQGKVFRLAGGSKASVAAIAYGISPISSEAAKNAITEAKAEGLKAPYINTAVTYGATDFTADSLAIKNTGANVIFPEMTDNSDYALVQDLDNAGAKVTAVLPVGLEPTVIGSASWKALQGTYFIDQFVPAQLHTKATQAMQAAMQKYEHVPESQFPDWAADEAWLGADLFIKGLELDGPNPTRAGMIDKLRHLTDYTGGGLLSHPINYAVIAKGQEAECVYVLKADASGFVPVQSAPVCGTPVSGSH
jgi:branched-chain amino acid transport system substrate-binding protein